MISPCRRPSQASTSSYSSSVPVISDIDEAPINTNKIFMDTPTRRTKKMSEKRDTVTSTAGLSVTTQAKREAGLVVPTPKEETWNVETETMKRKQDNLVPFPKPNSNSSKKEQEQEMDRLSAFLISVFKNFGLTWQHSVLLAYTCFILFKFFLSLLNMFQTLCQDKKGDQDLAGTPILPLMIVFDVLCDVILIYSVWFRLCSNKWSNRIDLGVVSFFAFFTAALVSMTLSVITVACNDPRHTSMFKTLNWLNIFVGGLACVAGGFAFEEHRSGFRRWHGNGSNALPPVPEDLESQCENFPAPPKNHKEQQHVTNYDSMQ